MYKQIMKKIKKQIAIVLVICISFILLGCQKNQYEDTLVIYALEDNYQMWELEDLVQKYKEENKGVKVVLQIGMKKDSDKRESVIQRLNNDIMAGKGPDILLLEGLPQEKYVEQGMLSDMKDYVDNQIEQQELFDKIMSSYRVGDAQYGIPYCIAMMNASMYEKSECMNNLDSLEGMLSCLHQLQQNKNKPVFENWSYNLMVSMFYRLYLAEAEGFLDKVSAERLEEYYTAVNEIYKMVEMDEVEKAGKTIERVSLLPLGYETFDLIATGDIQFALDYIETPENLRNLILMQQNGFGTKLLINDKELLCVPTMTFGVVNKKEKRDMVEHFLSFALSSKIQEEALSLPVNREAMTKKLQSFESGKITIMREETNTTKTFDFTKLEKNEIKNWIDTFDHTTCVGMADQKIFRIIMEQADKVIKGEMKEKEAAEEAYRQILIYQDE